MYQRPARSNKLYGIQTKLVKLTAALLLYSIDINTEIVYSISSQKLLKETLSYKQHCNIIHIACTTNKVTDTECRSIVTNKRKNPTTSEKLVLWSDQ